ncbi:VCBS repeat-containing protein [Kribbella sp. NBC_01505]|uniref:FG-GAP repeat domain-containing protein n=1 Tax=Kribbella sp. NBC_01505 TaxID=2903580 RepID=UPI00386FD88F
MFEHFARSSTVLRIPKRRLRAHVVVALLTLLVASAAVSISVGPPPADASASPSRPSSSGEAPIALNGDFNADGRTDIALAGTAGFRTLPVALAQGAGGAFTRTNHAAAEFAYWAGGPGVKIINEDFNGDGRTDLALTGAAGWTTVPVAMSNGDGTFTVHNSPVSQFPGWAAAPNATVTAGDFNNDGRTDLALTGAAGWTTVPVAMSNGDGTFTVHNSPVSQFPGWAAAPNATVTAGDFNNDGRTDLALTGAAGWTTIPVAMSNGNGTFTVQNNPAGQFPYWASGARTKVTAGDFNNDGRTDLALTGAPEFVTIPVAMSNGNGTFTVQNNPAGQFPYWASGARTKVTAGDFNNDGRTDLVLTGAPEFVTIPVAMSNGDGTFTVHNNPAGSFPYWASSEATVLGGDFNNDGRTDLAQTGEPGWTTIPVALSNGNGTFTVQNQALADFPQWAARASGPVDAPFTFGPETLIASAGTVVVRWGDRSKNESGFEVQKRNKVGDWVTIHSVPTVNRLGTNPAPTFTYSDADTSLSGQCYRIGAFNTTHTGYTDEKCTVRPDLSRFPQTVPNDIAQWQGLSGTNGGTGKLQTIARDEATFLAYDAGTFGVDLEFSENSDPWVVAAQGGPQVMAGQAIALNLVGRGWLTYENQSFGVDLGLSGSPSYEWIAIGDESTPASEAGAGRRLGSSGAYALYNTKNGSYLVNGNQTTGPDLVWYDPTPAPPPPPPPPPPGIRTYTIFNCADPARPLKFWTRDVTAGQMYDFAGIVETGWIGSGCQASNTNDFVFTVPTSNHTYEVISIDYTKSGCDTTGPPFVSSCIKSDTTFRGDTNGVNANFTIS